MFQAVHGLTYSPRGKPKRTSTTRHPILLECSPHIIQGGGRPPYHPQKMNHVFKVTSLRGKQVESKEWTQDALPGWMPSPEKGQTSYSSDLRRANMWPSGVIFISRHSHNLEINLGSPGSTIGVSPEFSKSRQLFAAPKSLPAAHGRFTTPGSPPSSVLQGSLGSRDRLKSWACSVSDKGSVPT